MATVGIHPPKTPVTKGSRTLAKVTIPNICKMPGPPAPFVPTPLPNIGKSELSPKGYSTTVKIEGNTVAIRGATFQSIGDIASKATGGGLISANTHGPAKFITPGSLTVKIEGKSVHLLGEPMLNNCGPSGGPPNTGASMTGADHQDIEKLDPEEILREIVCECDRHINAVQANRTKKADCKQLGDQKHDCCDDGVNLHNHLGKSPPLQTERGYHENTGRHDPLADRKWPRGASRQAYFKRYSGRIFPDGAILDSAGNVDQFFEYKFQCPKGTPTRKNAKDSAGNAAQNWTPARGKKRDQRTRTILLGDKQDPKVTKLPMLLTNESCTWMAVVRQLMSFKPGWR